MKDVYLGLGTNKGDREENLNQAIKSIEKFPQTELIGLSKIYETEPWGYTDQQDFLNMCLQIETELTPYDLLDWCQEVENKLKRKRKIKWGPRTIDVDILVYDDLKLNDEELTLPHPRIRERAFVLVPLGDLNEDLFIKGKSIKDWVAIVEVGGIKKYNSDLVIGKGV
ncbi:2-amino-4-hydroxy-6-hydroxymethyldihydropteridine diphosphokinase [Halanaerocella petrolearia]